MEKGLSQGTLKYNNYTSYSSKINQKVKCMECIKTNKTLAMVLFKNDQYQVSPKILPESDTFK